MDSWGYVTATLPSNVEKDVPVMGLLAHMDTSAAASGADVKPRVVKNYDGGEIVLNKDLGILLSPADFPELGDYIEDDLVVTDGTTLLGADDKAGIAEIMIAMEFQNLLPAFDRPEFTADREGFFHLVGMKGNCEEAKLGYIIRDHDFDSFEQRKATLQDAADFLNKCYGAGTVDLSIRDKYYNMKKMFIPIRGGTDRSRLSYMGLLTPDLFTGRIASITIS